MAHVIDRAFQLATSGYEQREFYATREQAEFMADKLRKSGNKVEVMPIWVHRGVRMTVTGGFHIYELWVKEGL